MPASATRAGAAAEVAEACVPMWWASRVGSSVGNAVCTTLAAQEERWTGGTAHMSNLT